MKKALPLLHQAVVDNDFSVVEREKNNAELIFSRDYLGFTAKELALFLAKLEIATPIRYHPSSENHIAG